MGAAGRSPGMPGFGERGPRALSLGEGETGRAGPWRSGASAERSPDGAKCATHRKFGWCKMHQPGGLEALSPPGTGAWLEGALGPSWAFSGVNYHRPSPRPSRVVSWGAGWRILHHRRGRGLVQDAPVNAGGGTECVWQYRAGWWNVFRTVVRMAMRPWWNWPATGGG